MISITQEMRKFLNENKNNLKLTKKSAEMLETEIYRLDCKQSEQLLELRSDEIKTRKNITQDLIDRIKELEQQLEDKKIKFFNRNSRGVTK